MSSKILIVTGGPVHKLDEFKEKADSTGMGVTCVSLYDFSYFLDEKSEYVLKVNGKDVADYDKIYIRVIGKRLEEASLVIDYARKKKIQMVDSVYSDTNLIPPTILKTLEMVRLHEAEIPIPKTFHARLSMIFDKGSKLLGFPFVIKGAVGQKARTVWAPKSENDEELYKDLRKLEREGKTFFAQNMVKASKRARVLVVGEKVLGGIVRSTKFRKRFQKKVNGEYPEPVKETLNPVPEEMAELSLKAAKATSFEVCGVDFLIEDETDKLFVIEANAAPSWKLIKKYTEADVEKEILEYLEGL